MTNSEEVLSRYEQLRAERFDLTKPRESVLGIARIMFIEAVEDADARGVFTDLAAFLDSELAVATLHGCFIELLGLEGLQEPTEEEARLIWGRHREPFRAAVRAAAAEIADRILQEAHP
jgi:hypothetical protein